MFATIPAAFLAALLFMFASMSASPALASGGGGGGGGGGDDAGISWMCPASNPSCDFTDRKGKPDSPSRTFNYEVPNAQRATPPTKAPPTRRARTPVPRPAIPVKAVVRVQNCLKEIGIDPGAPDGTLGPQTLQAFRQFQEMNGLEVRAFRIEDKDTLDLLFDLCEQPRLSDEVRTVRGTTAPAGPGGSAPETVSYNYEIPNAPQAAAATPAQTGVASAPATAITPQPVPAPVLQASAPPPGAATPAPGIAAPPPRSAPVQPRVALNCIPVDLYNLLLKTYGTARTLLPCPNACLAKPAGFSQVELDRLAAENNISWCRNCVQLAAHLPLEDILKIESRAAIQLCATPPAQACYLPAKTALKQYPEVRPIFRGSPVSVGNEADIAVLIGNENYGETYPANHNAQRDAAALRTVLTEQLGYREENIIDLRDAKLEDFHRVFGSGDGEGELAGRLKRRGGGELFIYVSSHGITPARQGKGYLLPADAKPGDLDNTAVPLDWLYERLGKTGAKKTMLVLEANFAPGVEALLSPPNLPKLPNTAVKVLPAIPVPGLAVFKASTRDQLTLEDPQYGIGLFTRYLIEGLSGKADAAPLGNGDQRIEAVELFVYTSNKVRQAAAKSFGVQQTPQISEAGNIIVGRLSN